MPTVRINGENRQFEEGTSISDLLRALDLPLEGVAVEVNRTIVPRRSHAEILLKDRDEVEIVTFVGGG
jgi:sulfur carrier protein